MRDYRDIIIRPVVTEKSMDLLADNKYTFIVDKSANKTEVKNAIEHLEYERQAKTDGAFFGKNPRTEKGYSNSEVR